MNLLDVVLKLHDMFSVNLLGGPRVKFAHVINLQKCTSLFFCLGLCWWFNNYSTTAIIYAALHGSYGLCWYIKHLTFPDNSFEIRITIPSAIMGWVSILGPYWISPWIIVTQNVNCSNLHLCIAIILFVVGVVVMMVADAQKYYTLRIKKDLITDGFFKHIRHINYSAEMLIYFSMATLSKHWLPMMVLLVIWSFIFVPRILNKERSMSRYDEWSNYKKNTRALIPYVW